MSSQERTLDRYQELMQINAASHVLRAARELGIFESLSGGQKTAEQLATTLGLDPQGLHLLLECLISLSVLERYEDDHALAPVMQLLCQYDGDLGDAAWQRLVSQVRLPTNSLDPASEPMGGPADEPTGSVRDYHDGLAATQWVHTPAAIQAAEMLDLGSPSDEPIVGSDRQAEPGSTETGAAETAGSNELDTAHSFRILDLGCGSAVWSCAMAFRDSRTTVLAVDAQPCLAAARSTADSIRLGDRFHTLAGDPESAELPAAAFDLVVIAQRFHAADSAMRGRLLDQACRALAPGGRIVLIDLFRGPARPRLAETIEALKAHVAAPQGGILTADELRQAFHARGLDDVRFSFIAASRLNLGMMVASSSDPKGSG